MTTRKPKARKPRKPVDRYFGGLTLGTYDDATCDHLGWLGIHGSEAYICLLDAKRIHLWAGKVIKWVEQREKVKRG